MSDDNRTLLYKEDDTAEKATLYVLDKSGVFRFFRLTDFLALGRKNDADETAAGEEEADIAVDSAITSHDHGEFIKLGSDFIYRDTESTNGSYVNGMPIGKNNSEGIYSKVLRHGDVIRIDGRNRKKPHKDAVLILFFKGTVSYKWQELKLGGESGDIIVGRAGFADSSNISIGEICKTQPDRAGKNNPADEGTVRQEVSGETCSKADGERDAQGNSRSGTGISIDDKMLSRQHMAFRRGIKSYSVRDLGSTNGVYVNNERIDAPEYLYPLDVIRAAHTCFVYLGNRFLYANDSLIGEELNIDIKKRVAGSRLKPRTLLQDINLSIEPGEMVMLLGGSGAGKTTFINAVIGYEKADATITKGNVNIYNDFDLIKNDIGYVTQQDLIRSDDIVFDTLKDAADIKMPSDMSEEEKIRRVDYTLELFGLTKERQNRVGNLSGGQKKKLNIAVEFISNPGLFILDEPDSGLDGPAAKELVRNLRVIADEGKILVMISHTPDRIIGYFDKVIILAKSTQSNSGRLAFYGSIREAYSNFEAGSFEDLIQKIKRKDEGGEGLADYYIEKFSKSHSRE